VGNRLSDYVGGVNRLPDLLCRSGANLLHCRFPREMFVQPAPHANADVSASPVRGDTICSIKSRRDYTRESTAEDGFYEPADISLRPVTRIGAANLIRVLRQLEVIAKRQAPRIAFKAKGRILFLDLAEIVAVQAEGNYVSLRHRPNAYLLRDPWAFGHSLSRILQPPQSERPSRSSEPR
jgi:hypothetical protein